jgi:radical SAM protein with 4Fe4S-binding SPASM domain
VDGKYMEENRPMRNKIERDAEYYEKLFVFCKRNNIGFHPMVYSNNVDKWIDNYRWFEQKNIKMYLLEVRNKEWNKKQTKDFCKFIEFLYLKSLDKSGTLYEKLSEENILTNDLSKSGRGIGCSIQQQLHIRLGDLTVFPCHRLMYDGMELFKFDAYFNAEPTNVELMMMIYSFNFINQPVCESCILKFACSGGCLGAQYENSKDMFMPIQEVCRLKHAKIATLIKTAKKTNTYSELLRIVSRDTNNSLRMLEQIINE